MDRVHLCRDLNTLDEDTEVFLAGWVDARRDHGKIIFLDLRDRSGKVQLVCQRQLAAHIRPESVISVSGKLKGRTNQANPSLDTGCLEIQVDSLEIVSPADPLPTIGSENSEQSLRYRYLALRNPEMVERLRFRHLACQKMRQYLSEKEFVEVNTPILGKSTPEGARDFLVPARLQPGNVYALPQSPQIFKQLLMISGLERYFQIAPCFRDEDLRADRQPEFSQLDIEASFLSTKALQEIVEGMIAELFEKMVGEKISTPFTHISWSTALESFGTDAPDLRWGMAAKSLLSQGQRSCSFGLRQRIENEGSCLGICVPKGRELSISCWQQLRDRICNPSDVEVAIVAHPEASIPEFGKPFSKHLVMEIMDIFNGSPSDMIVVAAGSLSSIYLLFQQLREAIGSLLPFSKRFAFAWVEGFPLFDTSGSVHHPFTAPHPEDVDKLGEGNVRALSYDLILNGKEIGGGSQRINDPNLQREVFSLLGLSDDEIESSFGFFIEALRYGTPPHAGLALGIDRLLTYMLGLDSIRQVIAFPKTQQGSDLLSGAPAKPSPKQLTEMREQLTAKRRK